MLTLPIPIALAVAVFVTIWFTVLFAILPLKIQSQAESGTIVRGTDPGAPIEPRLGLKAIITTIVSVVVFCILVIGLRVLG